MYLKDYQYTIEYFYEGFGIYFSDLQDSSHKVVLFYSEEAHTFSIRSSYSEEDVSLYENISDKNELTKYTLRVFFRLDLIEKMINQKKTTKPASTWI